ncbi:MAG: hypothetical protein ISS26_00060 [Candidatus Omnitrophica bacterium]|nr:hypothetical protein [Candidatus Omnitrophota bacterium]
MKKFLIFTICISVVIALIVLGCGVLTKDRLSKDQQKLVDAFGYPDIFALLMDAEKRVEVWTYFSCERSFSFSNGRFLRFVPQKRLPDYFQWPDFRPTEFKYGMTMKDMEKILGKPAASGKINSDLMEGVTMYDYFDQVKVALQGEKVVFVQTLPVPIEEAEDAR